MKTRQRRSSTTTRKEPIGSSCRKVNVSGQSKDDDAGTHPITADVPSKRGATGFTRRIQAQRHWLFPVLLIAAGVLVYANSLPGAFLFDDIRFIRQLRESDGDPSRSWWHLSTLGSLRPALTLSLAANYAWGGVDTTSYHVFNIVVHIVAGLALFGLVRRTLTLPSLGGRFDAFAADTLAFVTALLWIAHPLQTESVTYIVQRCESMMGMFFLLAMYSYVRGATSCSRWKWGWHVAAFLFYCVGLASKEVMVMLLPVVVIYDRVFLSAGWFTMLRQRWVMFAAFTIPIGLAFPVLLRLVLGGPDSTVGFVDPPVKPWEYLASQPQVILHYLRLAAVPHPQCLDYGWPVETRWLYIVVPSIAVLGLITASIWALVRGHRIGFLGIAFFLILAPTSSVVPIQDLCFEHRMYLPLACVLLTAVLSGYALIRRLPPRMREVTSLTLVVAVVLAWGGLTVTRNLSYYSPLEMWMDALAKTRHHRAGESLAKALNNVGAELLDADQPQESLAILQQAALLCTPFPQLEFNLSRALTNMGDFEAAQLHVQNALRAVPNEPACHQLLGQLARKQGRFLEAEGHFRDALRLAPRNAEVHSELAQCLADQNRTEDAIREFEDVLRRDPACADARHRLATTLAAAGRAEEAIQQAQELANRSPNDVRPHVLLGLIESQRGNYTAALTHLQRAQRLDPRRAAVYCLIGSVYRKANDLAAAQRAYEKSLELDPNLAEAERNLRELRAKDTGPGFDTPTGGSQKAKSPHLDR